MATCLYVTADLENARIVSHNGLDEITERHRVEISSGPLADVAGGASIARAKVGGCGPY